MFRNYNNACWAIFDFNSKINLVNLRNLFVYKPKDPFMKHLLRVCYLMFLIPISAFSQSVDRSSIPITNYAFLPQGIRWNPLSSGGYSHNFISDISQLTSINPAALQNINADQVALSYQYDSEISEAYIAEIGYKSPGRSLPQSLAILFTSDTWNFGFSVTQKFNSRLDFGSIPITTIENPAGTGKSFTPIYKSLVYSVSGALDYDLNHYIKGLSFGVTLSSDFYDISNKILDTELKSSSSGLGYNLGVHYQNRPDESSEITLAACYLKGAHISGKLKYDGPNFLSDVDGDSIRGQQIYALTPESFQVKMELPDKWNLGIRYSINQARLMFEMSYVMWENLGPFKNNIDFSGSYGYQMDDCFVSLGFLMTDKIYKSSMFYKDYNTAIFITAGFSVEWSGLLLNLALADSHNAYTEKWRKQSIAKIALSTHL